MSSRGIIPMVIDTGARRLPARGQALWAGLFGAGSEHETSAQDTIPAPDQRTGELLARFGVGHFRISHGLTLDGGNNI